MDSRATHFSSKNREDLFIRLAKRPEGTTSQETYEEGQKHGDSVTIEAYHNLGRRLVHKGILVADKTERHTRYKLGKNGEGQWLDEEQIAAIVNPDYPLIALTVMQESVRQLHSVPETAWVEIRERLKSVNARQLFSQAIQGYCQNLRDEIENYTLEEKAGTAIPELGKLRQRIQNEVSTLKSLVKFGLGISRQAVNLPINVDLAIGEWKRNKTDVCAVDVKKLETEIAQRVDGGSFIRELGNPKSDSNLLIAAVDGSTRSGLLSPEGEQGDFAVGSFPQVTINTSVAQINKDIKIGNTVSPAFLRLPEKPEDMQQSDNRHTIMAKMFYPDITDGEYIHSVLNAMDVLESRATSRVMKRWYTNRGQIEIRPADIVFRDGTVVPQDRDFSHYKQQDSYGRIVRDLIDTNWEIVSKCRSDDQSVAGVVKTANLRVFAPIINWFVCGLVASNENTQIQSWPLHSMNFVNDQVLLSRLLTAERKKDESWVRTCLAVRPFHAVTKFSDRYSSDPGQLPSELILKRARDVNEIGELEFATDDSWLRSGEFRGEKDSYIQMLKNCCYASCFIATVPRLDLNNVLPRIEFILPVLTAETGKFPEEESQIHFARLLAALSTVKFEVSADHSMFQTVTKIDILPSILIRVHDTVKIWATELASRVNEYIGFYISRHISASGRRGIRVRPWTASELKNFATQLQSERNLHAGMSDSTRKIQNANEANQ